MPRKITMDEAREIAHDVARQADKNRELAAERDAGPEFACSEWVEELAQSWERIASELANDKREITPEVRMLRYREIQILHHHADQLRAGMKSSSTGVFSDEAK